MSRIKKRVDYGRITVDKVEDHQFKSDRMSAQIRQVVTRISLYPIEGGNDKQDSLMASGPQYKEYKETKERVTWVDVAKGSTIESVQTMIDALEDACIYQIVSFDVMDCITDGHIHQINNPESDLTLEKMQDSKLLKDKDNNPILKEGKRIYIARYFSKTRKEDINHLISSNGEVINDNDCIELESPGSESNVA